MFSIANVIEQPICDMELDREINQEDVADENYRLATYNNTNN